MPKTKAENIPEHIDWSLTWEGARREQLAACCKAIALDHTVLKSSSKCSFTGV
jgi:hypothetical protein